MTLSLDAAVFASGNNNLLLVTFIIASCDASAYTLKWAQRLCAQQHGAAWSARTKFHSPQVGSARILLRYLLGDDRLMHTSRAFAIYQLTCHPEDAAALAVLELYTALARVLQACPACGVADQALLPLPAQLYQYTEPQSEEDILTCVDNIPQKQQGGAHVEASHRTVTRGQAVQLFDFLIHPVTGLLTSLQASTCSSYSLDLQQKAVELMTAVYSIACSPCLVDPDCCQLCCQGHWAAFNAAYAAEELTASCLHLGALQAMAKHKV